MTLSLLKLLITAKMDLSDLDEYENLFLLVQAEISQQRYFKNVHFSGSNFILFFHFKNHIKVQIIL